MSALTHVLVVDLTKCSGCKVCEMACSLEKEKICNPRLSRIKILKNEAMAVYLPVLTLDCDLCGKCVEFCSTEAIRFVEMDEAALLRRKMRVEEFICPTIASRRAMEVIYR